MAIQVIIGAQWGDEGKGKIVDLCAESADVIVRFGGGNNAGHTLKVQDKKLILHLLPSGVLYPDKWFVLGDGMVIDPWALIEEIDGLRDAQVALDDSRLVISSRAHLVMPYHRLLDELHEGTSSALGTTRRGIGPAYEDKAARRGIRAGELLRPGTLARRLKIALEAANERIARLGGTPLELEPLMAKVEQARKRLAPHVSDTVLMMQRWTDEGREILFEGAQGALLDLDYGTYPFVTSSTTLAGGVFSGGGVGPRALDQIIGVTKAYTTRVGEGPFPSELTGEVGEVLRAAGQEFGATTGRPRRCGWLDLPALKFAVRISGVTSLALTKLDVLAGIHPLCVCEAYEVEGKQIGHFPADIEDLQQAKPVLREVEGFEGDLAAARGLEDLPRGAQRFVELVEQETGVPVRLLSLGPDRDQTLNLMK